MKFPVISCIAIAGMLALGACTPPPEPIDIRDLCNRRTLTQEQLAYLQARPDFAEILQMISDTCPQLLAPGAINGGGNGGNGGNPPPPPPPVRPR